MQTEKNIEQLLSAFADEQKVRSKGALSVVLILTRNASQMPKPFSAARFLTGKKGQVAGTGGAAVKAILHDHGIERILAEEGGRTSRGSIDLMEAYVTLLNTLDGMGILDFPYIERWWVNRVNEFFAAKPIKVRADVSASLRQIILDLLSMALERQREGAGTMVVGAVIEHLVGAKLSLALPKATVEHKSYSSADESVKAKGDFFIGDTAIHVTVAPSEALVRKCMQNLSEGLHPLVVTTEDGVGGIMALAENDNIANRIDVLEISQFMATNLYEWISFKNQDRSGSLERLITAYNKIIDDCETDPSLKISLR